MPAALTAPVAPMPVVVPWKAPAPAEPATFAALAAFARYEAPTHRRTPAGSTALREVFSSRSSRRARRQRGQPARWCSSARGIRRCRAARRTEAASRPVKWRHSAGVDTSATCSVR